MWHVDTKARNTSSWWRYPKPGFYYQTWSEELYQLMPRLLEPPVTISQNPCENMSHFFISLLQVCSGIGTNGKLRTQTEWIASRASIVSQIPMILSLKLLSTITCDWAAHLATACYLPIYILPSRSNCLQRTLSWLRSSSLWNACQDSVISMM